MKLQRTFYLLITLWIANGLSSCKNQSEQAQADEQLPQDTVELAENELSETEDVPLPVDPKYNDLARFIAGMSQAEDSEYAKFSEEAAWQQYAQSADATWKQIYDTKIPTMITWRDQELKEINEAGGLLFYPFSGPDFLHAGIFFPEVDEIVMIGLEPIGKLPDFEKISQKSLAAYFNGIRHSLSTILSYSFFRTIAMAQDFTGKVVQDIDGTLPDILLFMARTNHTVLYYERVAIDPEGKLISVTPENSATLPDSTLYGTKLSYQRAEYPEERKTLYYFQMNLDDNPYFSRSGFSSAGLKTRKDARTFLENLDITSTYIKSASYLMYRENFSKIREVIQGKSKFFLQDDSGMPLRYIDQEQWDLTFYGSYFSPIPLFKARYQAALRAAYQKGENVKPLPFGIGYQYRAGTSNLMLAKRKN